VENADAELKISPQRQKVFVPLLHIENNRLKKKIDCLATGTMLPTLFEFASTINS
jgi:hypothetical protein